MLTIVSAKINHFLCKFDQLLKVDSKLNFGFLSAQLRSPDHSPRVDGRQVVGGALAVPPVVDKDPAVPHPLRPVAPQPKVEPEELCDPELGS